MKKAIDSKLTANIKFNGEKLNVITLKSEKKHGCPLSPYLFNIELVIMAREIWQPEEIKAL